MLAQRPSPPQLILSCDLLNDTCSLQNEDELTSTPDQDSNLDLPVIGSLICCYSSALDHVATEVVPVNILNISY
uniref:Uncharacterized protein n=1 Tax=Timema tahoe TaxID=61484 RepID=A0A7R9IG26_9NEOP|nr:unnamed protein product [Timema tahoe]